MMKELQKSLQDVLSERADEIHKDVLPRINGCLSLAELIISWIRKVDSKGWEDIIRPPPLGSRTIGAPSVMGPPPLPSSIAHHQVKQR